MRKRNRTPSWELGECPIPSGCKFSKNLADRGVRFFAERLHHVKGEWAGQKFRLADWQVRDIREIFGRIHDDGRRVIRQAYIEIPKKNGKSGMAAGIALYLLFADWEYGAEVYGAAADIYQASIIWQLASAMVNMDTALRRRTSGGRFILPSTKRICDPGSDSFYRALSAETIGKSGYNSHGVIFDEIHEQQDFRLWDVLTVGSGAARRQPLVYAITTSGIPGQSPVAEMLHAEADTILRGTAPCPPHLYPVIYDAEIEDDWTDPEVWRACNPALGEDNEVGLGRKFLRMADMRREFSDAQRRPSSQNTFRRWRLNQWLAQESRWIPLDAWLACGNAVIDPYHAGRLTWYGGLDLSSSSDLTAFVLHAHDENGIRWYKPYFWVPEGSIEDRANIEAHKYREWIAQGHLTATPGKTINFGMVRERIKELSQSLRIVEIGYDRMFASQMAQELTASGFKVKEISQGYRGYAEACDVFETAVIDGKVRHTSNPLMDWMMDCVRIKQRYDGAVMPCKPDRKKSSARIDGVVGALMATACQLAHPEPVNLWADPAMIRI